MAEATERRPFETAALAGRGVLAHAQPLSVLGWATGGAVFVVVLRLLTRAGWEDSIALGLPLAVVLGFAAHSAQYVVRALPLARTSPVRVTASLFAAAAVTSALWVAVANSWWECLSWLGLRLPDDRLTATMEILAAAGVFVYLVAAAGWYVAQAFAESAAERRRAFEAEIAQRDAELRALRAQVDPHFLFNSLNSIAGLITPDPAKARLMCQMLADFLRDSLALGSESRIPLEREVALAEQYVNVERVRFGARLGFKTHLSVDAAVVPVPPLILQPLVENAVRHGIATTLEGGTIEIDTRRAGERAVVTVVNPRDDMAGRRGTGFGLDLVRRRLAAAFGDRASLTVEPGRESYRVSLTIPIEETRRSEIIGRSQ